jgi:uncharacterized protein YndB with AHSA1/START domain
MAQYSFLSTWCVAAPLERVWDVLSVPEDYPEWWRGVRKATVLEPGKDGAQGTVGTLYRLQWRSKLPYTLEFDSRVTRVEKPYLMEGQASGELEGVGVWRLFDSSLGTVALYSWDVSTTRAWMNRLAFVGRPFFAWNHDYVMRQGAQGLADKLGAALITHN